LPRKISGDSLIDWIMLDIETLRFVQLGVLHEAYSKRRRCSRSYLAICLRMLERAGVLKRIRQGEYIVVQNSSAHRRRAEST